MFKWKRNGWTTSTGSAVVNQDLWERLDRLCEARRGAVRWEHVYGHSGDVGNEGADRLAVAGACLGAVL